MKPNLWPFCGAGRGVFCITGLLALSACVAFPTLDERITPEAAAAPFPTLQPLGPVLAQANAAPQISQTSVETAEARIAGLNARAAQLRGDPVVDGTTRGRMNAGVDQSGL